MPNIRSAKKAVRTISRRTARNQAIRSSIKTAYKKAVTAITGNAQDADGNVTQAVRALDKAATKGVIHKNKAARKKSRLMKRLNATRATAAV